MVWYLVCAASVLSDIEDEHTHTHNTRIPPTPRTYKRSINVMFWPLSGAMKQQNKSPQATLISSSTFMISFSIYVVVSFHNRHSAPTRCKVLVAEPLFNASLRFQKKTVLSAGGLQAKRLKRKRPKRFAKLSCLPRPPSTKLSSQTTQRWSISGVSWRISRACRQSCCRGPSGNTETIA
jgi:hypothetical protein